MTDAQMTPERIGLISDGMGRWALATKEEGHVAVHYIRKDLFDTEHEARVAAEAELAKLRARIAELTTENEQLDKAAYENLDDAQDKRDAEYEAANWQRRAKAAEARIAEMEAENERLRGDSPDTGDCIADAITTHWGERCDEYMPGCPCCDAWHRYDQILSALAAAKGGDA